MFSVRRLSKVYNRAMEYFHPPTSTTTTSLTPIISYKKHEWRCLIKKQDSVGDQRKSPKLYKCLKGVIQGRKIPSIHPILKGMWSLTFFFFFWDHISRLAKSYYMAWNDFELWSFCPDLMSLGFNVCTTTVPSWSVEDLTKGLYMPGKYSTNRATPLVP